MSDKVRKLIAERARARYGMPPDHDLLKAKDGEDVPAWQDRQVALGHYAPAARGGVYAIEIGSGPLVISTEPAAFSEMYGGIPPEFAEQWLQLKRGLKRGSSPTKADR